MLSTDKANYSIRSANQLLTKKEEDIIKTIKYQIPIQINDFGQIFTKIIIIIIEDMIGI